MHKVKDIIDVNNFVFCRDHGDEACLVCFFDHRPTNNFQIMDLPEFEGEEFELFNTDVRLVARRLPFSIQCNHEGKTPNSRSVTRTVNQSTFIGAALLLINAMDQLSNVESMRASTVTSALTGLKRFAKRPWNYGLVRSG